ncbi:MAG: hypothetical protein JWN00_848 [Actinomycetia bacterium]|jgi:Domain of unknown function (DUF397)|nr:hypothetical protein [Actinomycetes bacterium]
MPFGGVPILTWRKSTRSGQSLGCVETARLPAQRVGVRDSKNIATSPTLAFTGQEWKSFLGVAKSGELDLS